jgi:hypothetical protein
MSLRLKSVGIAVTVGLAFAGCGKSAKNAQPGDAQQPQTGPAWSLTLKSACTVAEEGQCLAQYGFTVSADGNYKVGPGPQGQLRAGSLTDSELADLKNQVQTAITSTAAVRAEGHEADVDNESDDTLTLSRPGAADRVLARNTGSDFYYMTNAADDAKSLHAAIRVLANSYYRLPFGDACGDAADKISAAALDVARCQSDSDCVYVNAYEGFEVVPPSNVEWLLTEDCSAVKPPLVANKLAIQGGAQTLTDLYNSARNTCGAEWNLSTFGIECAYDQKPTSTPPVCVQNRCQPRL